jgi:hypothetical protein
MIITSRNQLITLNLDEVDLEKLVQLLFLFLLHQMAFFRSNKENIHLRMQSSDLKPSWTKLRRRPKTIEATPHLARKLVIGLNR